MATLDTPKRKTARGVWVRGYKNVLLVASIDTEYGDVVTEF
jgi:hypothetical protein